MNSRKRSMSKEDEDMRGLHKEWDEVSCPICMDHPHNAVLLLCSSHDKGCRSYICDTSYRHSNCLDRFKRLESENADSSSPIPPPISSTNTSDNISGSASLNEETHETKLSLRCPLCRGNVIGWEVKEDARKYLNLKARSCSHETCVFSGRYRDLRRHARRVHPMARPADVPPSREREWRLLENQREYDDIVSALRSAMPGSLVLGDYVIENNGNDRERGPGGGDNGRWLSTLVLFQMIGSMGREVERRGGGRSRALLRHRNRTRQYLWGENLLGLQDQDNNINNENNNDDDEDDEDEDSDDDDEDDDDDVSDGDNEPEPRDDDSSVNRRRRRRLTRSTHENQL